MNSELSPAGRMRPRRRAGDWFAIPLPSGGFATGLLARAHSRKRAVFAYFFGPIRKDLPLSEDVLSYAPGDEAFRRHVFDANLISGRWPIVLRPSTWDPLIWPMPEFRMGEEYMDQIWAVRFDDENPESMIAKRPIPKHEIDSYQPVEIHGASITERDLARALGVPLPRPTPGTAAPEEEGVRHVLFVPRNRVATLVPELARIGFGDVNVVSDDDPVTVEVRQYGKYSELSGGVEDSEAQLTVAVERVGGEYDGREWIL
jgi:hypothetical protein